MTMYKVLPSAVPRGAVPRVGPPLPLRGDATGTKVHYPRPSLWSSFKYINWLEIVASDSTNSAT